MRRLVLALAVLGMSYMGTPAEAVAGARDWCEGYCLTLVASCYMSLGFFIGKDKCDAMYEGCMTGCLEAIAEEEK
jgi:hypothetical protein